MQFSAHTQPLEECKAGNHATGCSDWQVGRKILPFFLALVQYLHEYFTLNNSDSDVLHPPRIRLSLRQPRRLPDYVAACQSRLCPHLRLDRELAVPCRPQRQTCRWWGYRQIKTDRCNHCRVWLFVSRKCAVCVCVCDYCSGRNAPA